jgi:hypothetical protein
MGDSRFRFTIRQLMVQIAFGGALAGIPRSFFQAIPSTMGRVQFMVGAIFISVVYLLLCFAVFVPFSSAGDSIVPREARPFVFTAMVVAILFLLLLFVGASLGW